MAEIIVDTNAANREFAIAQDTTRREHEVAMHKRNARLELLRTAKEIIIENKRNKPVAERDVSEAEIVAFATTLEGFLDN